MKFSGIQRFTVLDYPGHVACIVFTPGCNFRCGYCHNPEFVRPESVKTLEPDFLDEDVIIRFLEGRRGLLDGIVVTGGEPTLHRGLPDFLRRVKALGFLIKLDTNGSLPDVLEPILREGLVDYVAMDVKTSLERYHELVTACVRPDAIRRSIELIKSLAPDYEFRTTIVSEHHGRPEFEAISKLIAGAKRYVLQGFRPDVTLDPSYGRHAPVTSVELEAIKTVFSPTIEKVFIR